MNCYWGCASQGYYPAGPDCLDAEPEDYTLRAGASEDEAAILREHRR